MGEDVSGNWFNFEGSSSCWDCLELWDGRRFISNEAWNLLNGWSYLYGDIIAQSQTQRPRRLRWLIHPWGKLSISLTGTFLWKAFLEVQLFSNSEKIKSVLDCWFSESGNIICRPVGILLKWNLISSMFGSFYFTSRSCLLFFVFRFRWDRRLRVSQLGFNQRRSKLISIRAQLVRNIPLITLHFLVQHTFF